MICPDCLEEYKFLRFDVDVQSLEHRGVFTCGCETELIFPEFITMEILDDRDLEDQVKYGRMYHLSRALHGKLEGKSTPSEMISVHNRHLEKYLQYFSEKQIQLFK